MTSNRPRVQRDLQVDHRDLVELILNNVQRLAVEQDAVANRRSCRPDRSCVATPVVGSTVNRNASRALHDHEHLAVGRSVDAVGVEIVIHMLVITAQRDGSTCDG